MDASGHRLGQLLGVADSAYAISTRLKAVPALQFFGSGWGDMLKADQFRKDFEDWQIDYQTRPCCPDVTLGIMESTPGGFLQLGSFEGVLSHHLEVGNRACEFELLTPAEKPVWACVLINPGTGDQSYAFRRLLATPLLRDGVACILPTPPFYGERRPREQWLHYISNFSDFVLQSGQLLAECMELLDWAARRFEGAVLGVSGLSWGAAMTAVLGFLAKKHALAVIPCLPSASAQVLVTGALRNEVSIERLAKENGIDDVVARKLLLGRMARTNLRETRHTAAGFPGPTGIKVICQVSAAQDAFIPPQDSMEVFSVLQSLDSQAVLDWIPGGHVSAFAAARWVFPSRILSTLSRLSTELKKPSRSRL